MFRVVAWHGARRLATREVLLGMRADVALLQEVGPGLRDRLRAAGYGISPHPRRLAGKYAHWPMVVRLSDRVEIEWFRQVDPTGEIGPDDLAVSDDKTLELVRVVPGDGTPAFVAASLYARWKRPHPSTNSSWKVGCADAAAHRAISDLSLFIGHRDPQWHRILAAGDLNTMPGAIDSPLAIPERDQTIFDRMKALGLEVIAPEGRTSDPPPGFPPGTRSVPTYYTIAQKAPAAATTQLDHVFASRGFHEQVRVRALNAPDEWGPSDHCRLLIEVGE